MPLGYVSKEMWERECARADALQVKYDALVQQVVRLKRKGYEIPGEGKPGRVVSGGPTPEESAAKRMHDQLIENIAKDLESIPGVSPDQARAEASRLRAAISGGSIGEPPV